MAPQDSSREPRELNAKEQLEQLQLSSIKQERRAAKGLLMQHPPGAAAVNKTQQKFMDFMQQNGKDLKSNRQRNRKHDSEHALELMLQRLSLQGQVNVVVKDNGTVELSTIHLTQMS